MSNSELQTMEKALGGAQKDLNSRSSSKTKDAGVNLNARMHIPRRPRDLMKYATPIFMESSISLVFLRLRQHASYIVTKDSVCCSIFALEANRRLCESCRWNVSVLGQQALEVYLLVDD